MIRDKLKQVNGVLIMARGDSRRMGHPKGLIKFAGDQITFVEKIIVLYQGRDWPLFVIIKPEDELPYRQVLSGFSNVEIILEKGGGDTAHSVLSGWEKIQANLTHLWVHPVDMPLVGEQTINLLHEKAQEHPHSIIRPVNGEIPGHPVIMPANCLDILQQKHKGALWPPGPVRQMVKSAVKEKLLEPIMDIPTNDPAVTKDFDTMADLAKVLENSSTGEDPK